MALVVVVTRIACIRRGEYFRHKQDVVSCRASRCAVVYWECQSRFTILAVVLIVLESRLQVISGVPSEVGSVILTVQRQTLFNLALLVVIRCVPTVVRKRTLLSLKALLIRCPKFSTSVSPRPCSSFAAKQLRVAVSVTVAHIALRESSADTLLTIQTFALPRILARASVIKHD